MYEEFLSGGEGLDHCRLSAERRRALVAECRAVVEEVKDWASRGCPIDRSVLKEQPKAKKVVQPDALTSEPELVTHMISSTGEGGGEGKEKGCTAADPDSFCQVDLPKIIENGEWVEFVHFLVENGIPCDSKFYEVISTLARWFCFVEFYDRPEKSASQLLRMYVLRKNNGMVSRLHSGETHEVFAHVDRIVDEVLRTTTAEGQKVFENLRRQRASGKYAKVWNFEAEITGRSTPCPSPSLQPYYLSCGSLTAAHASEPDHGDWIYQPDDTPLPDFVLEKVRAAFRQRKRQLRKKGGRFPTLDAITRFFNYLLAGRHRGQRRASKELMVQMGFPSSGSKRDGIINVLLRGGLLLKGGLPQ